MKAIIVSIFSLALSSFRSQPSMKLEIMALRHQLLVYQRKDKRPEIGHADRMFWSLLSKLWPRWREALYLVRPQTVIAWRRKRFREYWAKLCGTGKPGRPSVDPEIITLVRGMSRANPLWGSPHIEGELKRIRVFLARSTIEKYMI